MRGVQLIRIGTMIFSLIYLGMGESSATEKKFPSKPINVIIPFQPGDTDNNLRPFTDKMPQYLGQPLNFLYKPGASGAVGAGYVASAKPDGYTLVGSSQSSITIVPHTQKDSSYTWQSFAPICGLAEGPIVIAVQPGARWKNIKEVLAEAQQNPDKITWSSGSGALGSTTLVAQVFFKEAAIKLTLIPAQGSGPAVTAILGGHVDLVSTAITPAFPHIKAGTLRPILVFSDKRIRTLPEVPTASEIGFNVNASFLYGLLAPKGTPKEVVNTIYLGAKKVVENSGAAIEDQLGNIGMQLGLRGPAEYTDFLRVNDEFWAKVVKQMDIK